MKLPRTWDGGKPLGRNIYSLVLHAAREHLIHFPGRHPRFFSSAAQACESYLATLGLNRLRRNKFTSKRLHASEQSERPLSNHFIFISLGTT